MLHRPQHRPGEPVVLRHVGEIAHSGNSGLDGVSGLGGLAAVHGHQLGVVALAHPVDAISRAKIQKLVLVFWGDGFGHSFVQRPREVVITINEFAFTIPHPPICSTTVAFTTVGVVFPVIQESNPRLAYR